MLNPRYLAIAIALKPTTHVNAGALRSHQQDLCGLGFRVFL